MNWLLYITLILSVNKPVYMQLNITRPVYLEARPPDVHVGHDEVPIAGQVGVPAHAPPLHRRYQHNF